MKRSTNTRGFTLIEMMVVIAIIALLAGLLFPAVGASLKGAKKAKARQVCMSVESAILLYMNDHSGKLPIDDGDYGSSDQTYKDDDSKEVLAVLMAVQGALSEDDFLKRNPTRKVYLETDVASDDGELLDPWGNQYLIVMDTDLDGKIEYQSAPGERHRKKVVVVSFGPKGEDDPSDNVANVELVD